MLSRLSPACVLEFTATPNTTLNEREEKYPSNILVSVAARELANEEMIKMPLWVDTRTTWERTLADAVARLNMLHAAAESEVEYIRPMMLIKAQSGSGAELEARIRQCAPRIFVRLAMWQETIAARAKVPMPPPRAAREGREIAQEHADPGIDALRRTVAKWLREETGREPDLDSLLARGYEDLRPCLPAGA